MALETATYISDLVPANPLGGDPLAFADDHIRLVKATIKNSFPNVAGTVTKTHSELNAAHDQRVPVGGIIMWSGAVVNIPAGWLLCNGTLGTPNLMDRFVIGAGSAYGVGYTGGNKDQTVPSHTHTATLGGSTATAGSHGHGVYDPGHSHTVTQEGGRNTAYAYQNGSNDPFRGEVSATVTTAAAVTSIGIYAGGEHAHNLTASGTTDSAGVSGINANLPPYYALAFIMKSA